MAPHSSTLAWKEPGRLQTMGSQRVGHDGVISRSCIAEGNGSPLQCSCLENPRDGGAWWAVIYGVTLSWTRLKQQKQNRIVAADPDGDRTLNLHLMCIFGESVIFARETYSVYLFTAYS